MPDLLTSLVRRRLRNATGIYPTLVTEADIATGRVLVFSPHPDDETIGCGGTMRLHALRGDDVTVIVVTDGEKGFEHESKPDYARTRRQEAVDAFARLGVREHVFLGLPDGGVTVSDSNCDLVLDAIRRVDPDVIYCPSSEELHCDHKATASLVLGAVDYLSSDVQTIEYEVSQPLTANILVDITSVEAEKQAALSCYTSQQYPQSISELCRGMNRFRAVNLDSADIRFVEAFRSSRHQAVS